MNQDPNENKNTSGEANENLIAGKIDPVKKVAEPPPQQPTQSQPAVNQTPQPTPELNKETELQDEKTVEKVDMSQIIIEDQIDQGIKKSREKEENKRKLKEKLGPRLYDKYYEIVNFRISGNETIDAILKVMIGLTAIVVIVFLCIITYQVFRLMS